MSERHTRTRRRNHARRPDFWTVAPAVTEPRHAAIPTYPDGSIAIGTTDTCLRCEEPIVLTLTGWEHS